MFYLKQNKLLYRNGENMGKKIVGLLLAGVLVFMSVDLELLANESMTVEVDTNEEITVEVELDEESTSLSEIDEDVVIEAVIEDETIDDNETQSQMVLATQEDNLESEQIDDNETQSQTVLATQEDNLETEQIIVTEESRIEENYTSEIIENESVLEEKNTECEKLQGSEKSFGKCGDNLEWSIENGILNISGKGEMWDYEFGKNMTNSPWCIYCIENDISIKEVKIGYGITHIGNNSFGYLGDQYGYADGFNGELTIPDSVRSIGYGAFFNSSFSGKLVIPNSVAYIGDLAFFSCKGFIGDLIIPNNVINIEDNTFEECSGFNGRLIIPDSVINIGADAFSGCSGFSGQLIIPESVTNIGENAFSGCSGFTGQLIIPESVTNIGASAFSGCSGFTGQLIIPESVTNIGADAFYECSGFKGNLIIPNSMTNIEDEVFCNCLKLTDVYIPETVVKIYDNPFLYYYFDDNDDISSRNLILTLHCIKDSYAYNWAIENGFNVVEWDGITIGGDMPPDQDNSGKCGDNLIWKLEEGKEYNTQTSHLNKCLCTLKIQ